MNLSDKDWDLKEISDVTEILPQLFLGPKSDFVGKLEVLMGNQVDMGFDNLKNS